MANQNLSQFGEKLFVADADHTFIWDTAASISKRVSRNSWLSGTTADFHLGLADAALPVAQTISVQSVVAGTSNTAGANFSINGSQGTGTGAGGALLLRTAPAGSSGTAQNALVTAVAITSAGNVGIGTTSPTSKLHVEGSVTIAAAQALAWVGRVVIQVPAVGVIQISDTTGADFNRLSFGHNNLNSPALKRVGTELQVVQAGTTAASNFAAGDADLTFIEDRYRRKGAGTPEGVVTAPIGAIYHNTTGGAGTSFYVKESGTGNTGWVGK